MTTRTLRSLAVSGALATLASTGDAQQSRPAFRFEEATISLVHTALRQRSTTCHAIVAGYLARIERFDKRGPALNAIVLTNPNALAIADSLDRRFAASRTFVGALHCIPVIVKDNFQTAGLQTTAGTLALRGWTPRDDATMVKRLKDAGAIVLAKSNMAELAFSPYETVSSILPGYTNNPYALDRVTAGSSGGTGAAVAASFGVVGLGTDTGNSIRGPSAHNALVGIRSTMGLTSRDGVVPLNLASDIAGPMARTVTDAVAVFQIVAGYDPNDADTDATRARPVPDYAKALRRDGLKGARLAVLPQAYLTATTDTEVVRVFTRAVAELRRNGATVLDSVVIPELGRRRVQPVQVRFRAFSLVAQRHDAAGEDSRRADSVAPIPPVGRGATDFGPGRVAATGAESGVCGARSVSGSPASGGVAGDGRKSAGRVRLSDVEQPSALDWRPEYSAWRQQSAFLAEHRVSGHHGAHGLHSRRTPGGVTIARAALG
jgi:Asp-tRNA(Asn)/Glu-tRNA(Gln) amidotransferase A subunit family amidase